MMYDLSCEIMIFHHRVFSNSLAITSMEALVLCHSSFISRKTHLIITYMTMISRNYLSIVHHNQNSIQLDASSCILSYYSIDVSNRVLLFVIFTHALNVCKLLNNIWMCRTLKFKIISQIFNNLSAIPNRQ